MHEQGRKQQHFLGLSCLSGACLVVEEKASVWRYEEKEPRSVGEVNQLVGREDWETGAGQVASAGVNGAELHREFWTRQGSGSLRVKAESSAIHKSKIFKARSMWLPCQSFVCLVLGVLQRLWDEHTWVSPEFEWVSSLGSSFSWYLEKNPWFLVENTEFLRARGVALQSLWVLIVREQTSTLRKKMLGFSWGLSPLLPV